MSYAASLDASPRAARGVLRVDGRRVRRAVRTLTTLLLAGLFVGVLLLLLDTAVTEPEPRPTATELLAPGAAQADPSVSHPYGGALERPVSTEDLMGPGDLLGLGLLMLGLANGLIFLTTATWDGVAAPSPAETRRRLSTRSCPGTVPGGRREVRRTVPLRPTAPAASSGPALEDASALRSVPGRPMPGTTYASFPRLGVVRRDHVPTPAPPAVRAPDPDLEPAAEPAAELTPEPAPELASESAPEAAPEPAPEPVGETAGPREPVTELDPVVPEAPATPEPVAPEPVAEPVAEVAPAPRRPSPVPRDGGDGAQRATRRGSGPWGWRPARPDPVPWRNPAPAMAH